MISTYHDTSLPPFSQQKQLCLFMQNLIMIWSTFAPLYCSLSVMEKKTIIFSSYLDKKKEMPQHFNLQKTMTYELMKRNYLKTYPKLNKKYPDSQLKYRGGSAKNYPVSQLKNTGGSIKITQTLNCYK